MKRLLHIGRKLLPVVLLISFCVTTHADDAAVLPENTWRLDLQSIFYNPITKRFNSHGNTEDIAKDFNVELDSGVLPDLSLVEAGFGLTAGSASLGKSAVSFKWDIKQVTFQPAYGLTDKLSIGMNIPYSWQKNSVNASLDASSATIGINPGVPGGLAPLGYPGTSAPTAEDIQNLLASKGFKRVQTWSGEGVGDVEVGARYQYYKSDAWRLAFTGGLRFPTGRVDDPDNLVDRGFGTGAYAVLFRFHQDYVVQKPGVTSGLGIPDPGSFFVNTTLRYDHYLPDKQRLRVCSIHNPICSDNDNVDRKLGDVVEGEISASIGILKGLYLTPLYKYGRGFKDHYSGNKGFAYGDLATETDYTEQIFKISLSYSTLPLYIAKQFPFPANFSLSYRDRFAGTNNLYSSQFVGLEMYVVF